MLGVLNSGENPVASQTSFTIDNRTATGNKATWAFDGKTYPVYAYIVQNGDQLTNRISGSGSQLVCVVLAVTQVGDTYTLDQNGNQVITGTFNYTDYSEADLNNNRFNLGSASVDTRKTFGQPDLAGELPGDANAPANYINFSNWNYNGGFFVGNAPFLQTSDQSGTSRLQLYGTNVAWTKPVWTELSLLRLGSPNTNFAASMQIAPYYIITNDPNYNVPIGSVTWATAWNPFAASAVEGEPVTLNGNSPSPVLEYLNINMPAPPTPPVNWAGLPVAISVAMVNEASQVSNNFVGWQYFEDLTYQNTYPSPTIPISDGVPRLWIVDETATNTAHVNN